MKEINEKLYVNLDYLNQIEEVNGHWFLVEKNGAKIEIEESIARDLAKNLTTVNGSLYLSLDAVAHLDNVNGKWHAHLKNGFKMDIPQDVAEEIMVYEPTNAGGINYYQVEFYDDHFYHGDTELSYADLKAIMDDQSKFLWLSFDNLVYIPNIVVDGDNGALAFGTTFTRNDGSADNPDYQTYSSRLIINSNNEIGFEEFKLQRAEEAVTEERVNQLINAAVGNILEEGF